MQAVTVSTGITLLAKRSLLRNGVMIQASEDNDFYVSFIGDTNLSASNGFLIEAGTPPFYFSSNNRAIGPIYGIVGSGQAVVKIEEI